jgi:DNA-binding CsgD family transcriptional regulator
MKQALNLSPAFRSQEYLSDLLHLIYDAGLHPERWNQAVAAIATSFGTDKALLFTPMLAPQHGGFVFPAGISETTLQLWGSNYIEHDVWTQQIMARDLWVQGRVLLDTDMVPEQELVASQFYQAFLRHIGIARVCSGFVFENGSGTTATSCAVFRDLSDPPFNETDAQWMRILVPHISRSLGVMQRLDVARLQHASLLASFDRLPFGVVLMDNRLQVLHLNKAAQSVMQRKDGLHVLGGELHQYSGNSRPLVNQGGRAVATGLTAWLRAEHDAPAEQQPHFQQGYQVLRDGERRYVVQCSEISASGGWQAQGVAVSYVAFIHDPAALQLPEAPLLVEMFGLTQAQARVALILAGGTSYKEAAAQLHMSEETIRSHVKEIYPKTRVNKQADLVRLILSLGQHGV